MGESVPPIAFFLSLKLQLFLSIFSLQIHLTRSSATIWMKFSCTSHIFFQHISNPIVPFRVIHSSITSNYFPQIFPPEQYVFLFSILSFLKCFLFKSISSLVIISSVENFSFPNGSLQSVFLLKIYSRSTSFLPCLYSPPCEYVSFYILI